MRELEILRELANGLTNKEIAAHLSISLSTVKNHVSSILFKLNVKTRYQAIAQARSYGIIGPL